MTANRLGRLHQVALKANDLEASVAFYRDLLALPSSPVSNRRALPSSTSTEPA